MYKHTHTHTLNNKTFIIRDCENRNKPQSMVFPFHTITVFASEQQQ